jgi:hypothetical protein
MLREVRDVHADFGIAMILLSPILTYFYGKRWYCSCLGCGGLAETAEIVLDICLVKLKPHGK